MTSDCAAPTGGTMNDMQWSSFYQHMIVVEACLNDIRNTLDSILIVLTKLGEQNARLHARANK